MEGQNVQICFQIYGRLENLGGGAEGKAVAGEVFLLGWSGKGGGEYCGGGCGKWREGLVLRIIQRWWAAKGECGAVWGALKGALLKAVQGSAGVGDTCGTRRRWGGFQ